MKRHPVADSRADTSARERLLRRISQDGPVTATALAETEQVSGTAIRKHLDHLAAAGLIEEHSLAAPPRTRGRPARSWVLTAGGHEALTSDYNHIALDALRFLEAEAGAEAVERFARQRVASWAERYAPSVNAAGPDRTARVEALAAALRADGFATSTRPVAGPADQQLGVQLCQGHCPVQGVATEFPQLCDAETEAFSDLLGVHVQRLATLAQGDHVCTTFVTTATPESTPTSTIGEQR